MKTLNTYLTGLLFAAISFTHPLQAQQAFGEIRGLVKNTDLETVPFATVKILQGDQLIGGTITDEKGLYKFKPLNPGSYEVMIMEASHNTKKISKVKVIPGDATYLDVKLSPNTLDMVIVQAEEYTPPAIDRTMYQFESISGKELSETAGWTNGDVMSAVPLLVSDVVVDGSGGLHFRGARGDASSSYIDGVKTYADNIIPGLAIDNLTIFTGGVPAMYGDMMGGAVIVTTKSYFSGMRDKNLRIAEQRERRAEEKRQKQAQLDEDNRQKEIEAEKAKEKAEKEAGEKK